MIKKLIVCASVLVLGVLPFTYAHAQKDQTSLQIEVQEILMDILTRYGKELYARGDFEEAAYVFHHIRSFNERHADARKYLEKIRRKDPNISIPNLDPARRRAIARRIELIEDRVKSMTAKGKKPSVNISEIERLAAVEADTPVATGNHYELIEDHVTSLEDSIGRDQVSLEQIRAIEAAYQGELEKTAEESRTLAKLLRIKNDELTRLQAEHDAKDLALEEEVDRYREQIARRQQEIEDLKRALSDAKISSKAAVEDAIRTKNTELAVLEAKQHDYDQIRSQYEEDKEVWNDELQRAQDRITRLNDQIAELTGQLDNVEKAAVAREYDKVAMHRFELDARIKEDQNTIRMLNDRIAELTAELNGTKVNTTQKRSIEVPVSASVNKSVRSKAVTKTTHRKFEHIIDESDPDIARLEEAINQKDALLRDYKMQIASLSAIVEMRSDKYGTQMVKLGKELARKELLLKEAGHAYRPDADDYADLEAAKMAIDLEEKEEESAKLESQVEDLRKEIAQAELEAQHKDSSLQDKSGQLQTLQNKFQDLEGRLKLVQQLLEEKNKEIATLQTELGKINAEAAPASEPNTVPGNL